MAGEAGFEPATSALTMRRSPAELLATTGAPAIPHYLRWLPGKQKTPPSWSPEAGSVGSRPGPGARCSGHRDILRAHPWAFDPNRVLRNSVPIPLSWRRLDAQ